MGLTPSFKIVANNQDITAKIKTRLLSLSITDNSGTNSDTVEISLDDADHVLELPSTGAELNVFLGYAETGLVHMDTYIVDEIELSGPPNTMRIRAKAADMGKNLKAPKTKTWQKEGKPPERIKLSEIVETIAAEHSMEAKISDEFKDVAYLVVNQTNESDLNLLTRLAKNLDAVAKPANGNLLFVKKGEVKTVTGKNILSTTLSPKDVINWSITIAERNSYKSVIIRYQDKSAAKIVDVTVGEGEPRFDVRELCKDEHEAQKIGKAKLTALNRDRSTADINVVGNPVLMAESSLVLSGFRSGVDGNWIIETVNHIFAKTGYTSSISATNKEIF